MNAFCYVTGMSLNYAIKISDTYLCLLNWMLNIHLSRAYAFRYNNRSWARDLLLWFMKTLKNQHRYYINPSKHHHNLSKLSSNSYHIAFWCNPKPHITLTYSLKGFLCNGMSKETFYWMYNRHEKCTCLNQKFISILTQIYLSKT